MATRKRCAVLALGCFGDQRPQNPLSAFFCCCRRRAAVVAEERCKASKPKHGATIQLAREIAMKHLNNPGKYASITTAARAEGWPKDGDKSTLHMAHREMRNALRQLQTPGSAASPPVVSNATTTRATREPTPSSTTLDSMVNTNMEASSDHPGPSSVTTFDVAATDSTVPETAAPVCDWFLFLSLAKCIH